MILTMMDNKDPNFDWEEFSPELPRIRPNDFNDWWDKDKFVYSYVSIMYLIVNCPFNFDKWWDKDKIEIKEFSEYLPNFSNKFDMWWDKDKFDYRYMKTLAKFCHNNFLEWWDKDKCDNTNDEGCFYLISNCSDHFDLWWDESMIDGPHHIKQLSKYCNKHISSWWDRKKYGYEYDRELIDYCSNTFKQFCVWFDNTFYIIDVKEYLLEHKPNYYYRWIKLQPKEEQLRILYNGSKLIVDV